MGGLVGDCFDDADFPRSSSVLFVDKKVVFSVGYKPPVPFEIKKKIVNLNPEMEITISTIMVAMCFCFTPLLLLQSWE